jgi:hypothetical protein
LLIALALTGSAGVANVATTTTSGSWYAPYAAWLECASGNVGACMAAGGGGGTVSPDNPGDPTVKNK